MYLSLVWAALCDLLYFALHVTCSGTFPKPLPPRQERECLERIRQGDLSAKNTLIEHNLRLVAHIVKKYYAVSGEQEDLISIGTIGLIKAASTFDFQKSNKFSTYASKCIENEILMHFRSRRKSASDVSLSEPVDTDREGNTRDISLREIAEFVEGSSLNAISRDSQTRYLNVTAGIDEEHNVTLVSNRLQSELQKISLPEGYEIAMTGEDEMINDAISQLYLMLLLAVIFIYLVMVAQFQSFLSPFIIMFTIPLAFTGGLFALFFTGNEVSVVAMIGFVVLAGIIVNNGIVMVDYINQLRREGMDKKEAIIESGKTRLRPILMTALTTILSMSTMAAGLGDGSEMMQPMAIVTEGGLIYGTLLTLIVVPCIYDAFNREKNMVEEEL